MNTTDVPQFKRFGFDNQKYKQLQKDEILRRLQATNNGRLYLEIGGKLLKDPHGARVLPGFDSEVKISILKELNTPFDILFCMNYDDILQNRQLNNRSNSYLDSSLVLIRKIKEVFNVQPFVIINKIKDDSIPAFTQALKQISEITSHRYLRYYIPNYPNNTSEILSNNGYGKDEYVPLTNKLVVVTGSASNSGKMSTCLGMIYLDSKNNLNSTYAKYETFPIWNLPLEHPINLAYEAATADIGDRNVLDTYHQQEYGISSVNYNRDVDAFKILKQLTKDFLPENNLISTYKSPTDMGISNAKEAITNDEIVSIAALQEIKRRKQWYLEIAQNNLGEKAWAKICEELEKDALKYIQEKKYNPILDLV